MDKLLKKYNISLDIGTNSVGWSITDGMYNLLKFKKKNMWGVRLFEEGQTAEKRRGYRSFKRRLARKKNRVLLLQYLMTEDINKVDKDFYTRLKESYLHLEDRYIKNKSNLFIGKDFEDTDYYENYKTIYHLRKELIENKEKKDVRLVYLALHHILKYRGNFIYEGQNFEASKGIEVYLSEIIEKFSLFDISIQNKPFEMKEILLDTNVGNKLKLEKLIKLCMENKEDKSLLTNIFNGFLGLTINIEKIFPDVDYLDTEDKKLKLKFSDDDIDEKLSLIEKCLGDAYICIELMKMVYDSVILGKILKSSNDNERNYISYSMVEGYKKFGEELHFIRHIIDKYDRDLFIELFRYELVKDKTKKGEKSDITDNKEYFKKESPLYNLYIKNRNKAYGKKPIKEIFYQKIQKLIEDNIDDGYRTDEKNNILKEIEKDSLLIPQNITDNSAVPYQLNLIEMEKIIENQSVYYESLSKNKDKLLSILKFRIPYYVGPLNRSSRVFSWFERKEDLNSGGTVEGKIYPWNFEEIVDIDKSAEKFIRRMTNKCSYLINKDVIPKNSLLYTDYMFYNEINKLQIGNNRRDKYSIEDLKQEVFMKHKTVSKKHIQDWAINNHLYVDYEFGVEGLGGDDKANCSLQSYIDFTEIIGEITFENIDMIEKIIEWITVFEDKRILKRKIIQQYQEIGKLSIDQIDKICNLKYKGWSSLSRELLNDVCYINDYGRNLNIMDILRETNLNFMQIINNKDYDFAKKIYEENKTEDKVRFTYKALVENLQGSPAIKKGIWQSIKIIQEIISVMKTYPQNIFIEFARSDEKSKMTTKKINLLDKIYKDKIVGFDNIKKEIKIFKNKNITKKQQLYFMQQGRCMYTNQPLSLDHLEECQIDHIVYQSLIKDDSIDNIVLVKSKSNQDRGNHAMPGSFVAEDIQLWWKQLLNNKLISSKKYSNLVKRSLSKAEEEGFIQRQLVETRQISKHLANLLKGCYGDFGTKVVSIKAGLVDNFRKKYDIYKNRGVNDHHHAKDAYITGVIGEYIISRYPKLESEFIYGEYKKYSNKKSNENEIDNKNKWGFIIDGMRWSFKNEEGIVVWDPNNSIGTIKNQLNYKDFFVTKKLEENSGEMFNITIQKASESGTCKAPIPIKKGLDPAKYGYYSGEQSAYFSVVEYLEGKKNKKIKKELIGVPIRFAKIINEDRDKLKKYFEEEKGLEGVKILKDKILKYQLIENSNGRFLIAGQSEQHNGKQLILDKYFEKLVYKMNNPNNPKLGNIEDIEIVEIYDYLLEKMEQHYPVFKNSLKKIKDKKDEFESLSTKEKVKIVNEIMNITKVSSVTANLKDIECSTEQGRLTKPIKIEDTTFIHQSVTGMFQKKERY
ncbi:MAG: type II CRISPR RNA-guided endonuclease Cas9 [Oscillospiraceae bacterium]|nr:type II CRISPR RNA-guided endonuclease Cas9 [Oscillospiraceae bacterium]